MTDEIMDAIGKIDDDLLKETDELRRSPKRPKKRWAVWQKVCGAAAAACFCVVIGFLVSNIKMGSFAPPAETYEVNSPSMAESKEAAGDYRTSNDGAEEEAAAEEQKAGSSGSGHMGCEVFFCSLTDFDAGIWVSDETGDETGEMSFEEALEILENTDVSWYLETGDAEDKEELFTFAEDAGYDDVLQRCVNK